MPKFRKRPIVIEAEQWFPHKRIEGVVVSPVLEPTPDNPGGCYGQIATLEGVMCCNPGDWIITGVKGEKYPCKDEIFRLTYEPVDADPADEWQRLTTGSMVAACHTLAADARPTSRPARSIKIPGPAGPISLTPMCDDCELSDDFCPTCERRPDAIPAATATEVTKPEPGRGG